MAYPQQQQKKEFPFGPGDFKLGLEGTAKSNGRKPNLIVDPGEKGVAIRARFAAEKAGKDITFNVNMSYLDFPVFIHALNQVAETPGTDKTSVSMALRYFGGGKWNYSGTEITIGRNESGIVYFCLVSKEIECVYYKLIKDGAVQLVGHDKAPLDMRLNSKLAVKAYTAWLETLTAEGLSNAFSIGRMERTAQQGEYHQGGGAQAPQAQGGYQPPQQQVPQGQPEAQNSPATDFDDDIPF